VRLTPRLTSSHPLGRDRIWLKRNLVATENGSHNDFPAPAALLTPQLTLHSPFRSPLLPSALSSLIGRQQAGFFDRAQERGSRRNRSGIDGAQGHEDLGGGTRGRRNGSGHLWLEYVLCLCDAPATLLDPSSLPNLHAALLTLSPLTCPFNSYCAEYDKGPDHL
jgi:hypothetical protein